MKEEVCRRLVAEGGYAIDPARAARVLRVTVEGVWLDLMSTREPYSKQEASKTVFFCASAFFSRHFDIDGLKDIRG